MKIHWPGTYLKLGLIIRNSMAPVKITHVNTSGSLEMKQRTTGMDEDL